MFRSEDRGARQNWSKPAISWESKLKTAVGTTDFTDDTDKEGIAVQGCSPGGWPRKRFSTMTKPSQAKGLLHKVRDWLGRLNSNERSLCLRLAAGRTKDESRFQR